MQCFKYAHRSHPLLAPLIHALVLAISGNRDISLRQWDFLRSHCKYSALCNTELFGDNINKEIDQLTKSSQLGIRLSNFQRGHGFRFHLYTAATTELAASGQQTLPFYQFLLPEQRAIDDEIRSLSKHIIQGHTLNQGKSFCQFLFGGKKNPASLASFLI